MDTTVLRDPFIWVQDDVLTEEFCNHCIEKFNADDRSYAGVTGGGLQKHIKDSLDLKITGKEDWVEEDTVIHNSLNRCLVAYKSDVSSKIPLIHRTTDIPHSVEFVDHAHGDNLSDSGYQIQKTLPGAGYVWHHDFLIKKSSGIRYLTFIYYLNTVEEGWTQFHTGEQCAPKAGRVMIFPSTWTYIHQGYPPQQVKYILTGWVHESMEKV